MWKGESWLERKTEIEREAQTEEEGRRSTDNIERENHTYCTKMHKYERERDRETDRLRPQRVSQGLRERNRNRERHSKQS
jgi:hypothetical protein